MILNNINNCFLGSTKINKIMLGNIKIFPKDEKFYIDVKPKYLWLSNINLEGIIDVLSNTDWKIQN